MPAAIEVDSVSKSFLLPHQARNSIKEVMLHPFHKTDYERNAALEDVSFEIEQGEFFGVVGSNGSGKSTLLKIMAGIYRADAGSVTVNGKLSPFIELGVGFNPDLNARDNIRINGTLLGLDRRELEARLDEIIAFAELERFVDQRLKNYSSGMQLRLAFSIAVQVPFDVLLLDEVLAVGDAAFQEKCFGVFGELRAAGKTIVFVSHDLESMRRFCDRAAFLAQGKLRSIGPVDDVVDAYLALTALGTAGAESGIRGPVGATPG
jgi:ABC-type polysaccharide/polyol phosphate transport system ATPase subunit